MTRTTNARVAGLTYLAYIALAYPAMLLFGRATRGEGIPAKLARIAQHATDIGRALLNAFEAEASARGALTITLGTDDNSGMTSLSGVNLYRDIPEYIAELRDLGRNHPFLFYIKLGFVVTGVMPDANGPGRPDILMSKPVGGRL